MFIYSAGLKFLKNEKNLKLNSGDDAAFNFNYIVDNNHGEAAREVMFWFYKRNNLKQIIAIQIETLFFNPALNLTWSYKIDIKADLTSTAKLKLTEVTEEALSGITFFCNIKYKSQGFAMEETTLEIKLEIVCKYSRNKVCLIQTSADSSKAITT